jgi:hypothetical protein
MPQNQKLSATENMEGSDYHKFKFDGNKPDASLLLDMGQALLAVSWAGTFGLSKYPRNSWLKVPNGILRYTAGAARHLLKEGMEIYDDESGLLHAAHEAWCSCARLELMLRSGISLKDPNRKENTNGKQ